MPKSLSDHKLPYPLTTHKYHQYTPYDSWENFYTGKWDTNAGQKSAY